MASCVTEFPGRKVWRWTAIWGGPRWLYRTPLLRSSTRSHTCTWTHAHARTCTHRCAHGHMCIRSHTHDHSHMCTHDMRTHRPTLQVHAGPASRLHALFSCLPGPPSRPVLALEFSMNPPSRLMSSADSEWHRARRRCGRWGAGQGGIETWDRRPLQEKACEDPP